MEIGGDRFVQRCLTCQKSKGAAMNDDLYLPLLVPLRPWEYIGMDFMLGLPPTIRRSGSSLVILDRFSMMNHFIACMKSNDASHVADLFFREVYKLQGVPSSIVLERDSKILGNFRRTLWKEVGTSLSYSITFHLQTDARLWLTTEILGTCLEAL